MRVLLAVCASAGLALGCGDGGSLSAPKSIRLCGELEGVGPVQPEVVGEDEYGCPTFEPAACTESLPMYKLLCGAGCFPATAPRSDGDTWFIGCLAVPPGPVNCLETAQPLPPYCFVDPYLDEVFWFSQGDCSGSINVAVALAQCWAPCNEIAAEAIAHLCP